MKLEYQILIAWLLDMVLGDPRWLPHPVRIIGRFAAVIEGPLRRSITHARVAGVIAAALVVGVTAAMTAAVLYLARNLHPLLGDGVAIIIFYTAFSTRDLADHASAVHEALDRGDLPSAQRLVGMMVGRDTAAMDEEAVARAAVESVAENSVDGVVAPLIFAAAAGPVGAMVYKAVSTLDSTFGYRNERYRDFGWASARIDDLANYIPARITAFLLMTAALTRGSFARALAVCRRDGRLHASPNSGLSEAAMAGALGVQLGGPVLRSGIPQEMPYLGAPAARPEAGTITAATTLMMMTSGLALASLLALRIGISTLARG